MSDQVRTRVWYHLRPIYFFVSYKGKLAEAGNWVISCVAEVAVKETNKENIGSFADIELFEFLFCGDGF